MKRQRPSDSADAFDALARDAGYAELDYQDTEEEPDEDDLDYTPPCVYCGGEGYHEIDCEALDLFPPATEPA